MTSTTQEESSNTTSTSLILGDTMEESQNGDEGTPSPPESSMQTSSAEKSKGHDNPHHPQQRNQQQQQKKRGMKPKSKRNRKRARSQLHDIEEQEYQTSVRRLEIDGHPVTSSVEWLRTVEPYPYTFSTFAKARWIGRTVFDVYHTEFGSYPKVTNKQPSIIDCREQSVVMIASTSIFFFSPATYIYMHNCLYSPFIYFIELL
jgi:hypothetical protein